MAGLGIRQAFLRRELVPLLSRPVAEREASTALSLFEDLRIAFCGFLTGEPVRRYEVKAGQAFQATTKKSSQNSKGR